jgi:hypothetical protein
MSIGEYMIEERPMFSLLSLFSFLAQSLPPRVNLTQKNPHHIEGKRIIGFFCNNTCCTEIMIFIAPWISSYIVFCTNYVLCL